MAAGSDPLVAAGSIQTSLFDTQNLAEVTDPRYPSERLIICHNPLLGEKRAKKRQDMLQATEKGLAKVTAMVARGAAGGRAGLGRRRSASVSGGW
jgi:hypothetical protein